MLSIDLASHSPVRTCPLRNSGQLIHISLVNPMDRGAWAAAIHGVAYSQTQLKGLSMHLGPHKALSSIPDN